jgi:predicted nucleic acid-binding protein
VIDGTPPFAVVDASVAVKWLVVEERSPLAERLYTHSYASGRPLVAPPLFRNEVVNALYRRLRRTLLQESRADAMVTRFFDFDVQVRDLPGLLQEAYAFAKRHEFGAIYDSLYVVLARDLGTLLWTDDRKLINAVASAAPWVRWIGDYPADVA